MDPLLASAEQVGQFATPTLRNVALTAPYMHGGHFATLDEVIDFYNELEGVEAVGHRDDTLVELDLTDEEHDELVASLESLTGTPPESKWLQPPTQDPAP